MAKKEDKKKKNPEEGKKAEKSEKKSLIGRLLPIVIIIVVAGICAGAGFSLGRLLAGESPPNPADPNSVSNVPEQTTDIQTTGNPEDGSEDVWYYDFEPVVVNLNEPSVARYISLSITLQINSELSEKNGNDLMDKEKPILTDWLTVYLAGLGIEDIRGDKNLKSIQSQIMNAFNDKLFPDSKAHIKKVLFRNFAVQ